MANRAPSIKGYCLVHRVPWTGTEDEQERANLKALDAELWLKSLGIMSKVVGHYDEILIYANSADMLRQEEKIRQAAAV